MKTVYMKEKSVKFNLFFDLRIRMYFPKGKSVKDMYEFMRD